MCVSFYEIHVKIVFTLIAQFTADRAPHLCRLLTLPP